MSDYSVQEAGAGASPTASPLLDNTVTSQNQNHFVTHYKMIRSGGIIEVYKFSDILHIGIKGERPIKKNKKVKEEKHEDRSEEYKERTIRKAKNRIRRLTQMNFDRVGKFLTLTFEDTKEFNIKSLSECLIRFQAFVKRLRKRYPDVRYIAVPEFQDKFDRGAVHYHLILDLPFVPIEDLRLLWGHGFIKINMIMNHGAVGGYMAKYLAKYAGDKRFTAHRSFYSSKNLIQPIVEYGEHLKEVIDSLEEKGVFPSYGSSYISEWCGEISYSSYNLYQLGLLDKTK